MPVMPDHVPGNCSRGFRSSAAIAIGTVFPLRDTWQRRLVSVIFSGHLRRIAQPLLFRYWFKRGTNREVMTTVGGFNLLVLPTVFHPKYFGSSLILGEYVESQPLEGKTFLDMGTGCGIIGFFAAQKGAIVTAVDINPRAVACASRNAISCGF